MCREQGVPEPHIIIVPLSTLPNWERELAKWAPQLYVVTIKGNASARATAKKYDCLLPPPPNGNAAGRKRTRHDGTRFNVMLATYETVLQVPSCPPTWHHRTIRPCSCDAVHAVGVNRSAAAGCACSHASTGALKDGLMSIF